MEIIDSIISFFKKLKIPLEIIIFTMFLISSFLNFAPSNVIIFLNLSDVKGEWNEICWLISTSLILGYFLIPIFYIIKNKIMNYFLIKNTAKTINELTVQQRNLLFLIYKEETKLVNINNADVSFLLALKLIYISNLSSGEGIFRYGSPYIFSACLQLVSKKSVEKYFIKELDNNENRRKEN